MARAGVIADRRAPLSKDRVLRTAIRLADQGGIGSLTMRKLAHELGVEAMSLYFYVANKDDLLSGMVDMVEGEVEPPSGGADWKAAIRKSAISFRAVLGRHPWAANPMMVSAKKVGIGTARLQYMDSLLGRLRGAGFSANMTHHAYHALDSHIVGSTLWAAGFSAIKEEALDLGRTLLRELPRDEYPYFLEHLEQHLTKSVREGPSEFEFGLDLILDGLEKFRDEAPRRSMSTRRADRPTRRSRVLRRRGEVTRPSIERDRG